MKNNYDNRYEMKKQSKDEITATNVTCYEPTSAKELLTLEVQNHSGMVHFLKIYE